MKTLRMIGMALFAVLMCVNFASCSNEEVLPDEPAQDKYITVGLDCVGEYLDITESPLSRGATGDVHSVQIYSLEEDGSKTPYAHGVFKNTLEGLTIKLLQGAKYMFQVAIGIQNTYTLGYNSDFVYSSAAITKYPYDNIQINHEGFYGELDNYTPKEGENVEISTKRVSYAANFIANALNEGTLRVDILNERHTPYTLLHYVNLTPEVPTSDKIYSFSDAYNAWKGIYTATGEKDSETGEPIYEYKDYSSEKTLNINWTKENGDVIPFGTYNVTFKRNVKTTIRINVADLPSVSNGITVTKEETTITDDENEYEISGGEIVEIPVNSEP